MLLSLRKAGYGTETKVQMHTEYAFYFLVRRRSRKPQCVLFLYRFGMRIFWNGGVYVLYVETARMRFRRLFFSIAKVEEPAGKQHSFRFCRRKTKFPTKTPRGTTTVPTKILFFVVFWRLCGWCMTQRIFGDGKNGFSGERTRETPVIIIYGNGEVSLYNSDSKRVQCTPFSLCAAEAAHMTLSAKLKCLKNTENVFFV